MYEQFGISKKIEELSIKVEQELENQFKNIEKVCEVNSLKVLQAFQKNEMIERLFAYNKALNSIEESKNN